MGIKQYNSGNQVFLINPETGKWGISRMQGLSRLEQELSYSVDINKHYTGVNQFVLNSSNECNLSCVYCSEKEHRNNCETIGLDIGKRAVDIASESNGRTKIVFHGSEPHKNFEWIKEVVKYAKDKQKEVTFCMQSNLVDVPEGFYDFVNEYNIGISTSLDGTRELHDAMRKKNNGNPTYDLVLEGIKKVMAIQGNIHVNSVITPYNLPHLIEIKSHFEDIGIDSWQTVPALSARKKLMPNPKKLGEEYINLFEITLQKINAGEQKMKISNLSQYINSFLFINPIDACRQCSSGAQHPLLAIDSKGEVYPCDYFWGNKETQCGDILSDNLSTLTNNPKNLRFREINETSCKSCTWKRLCGGGCLAEKQLFENYYCATHKKVYEYLACKMPELVSGGLLKKIAEWNLTKQIQTKQI